MTCPAHQALLIGGQWIQAASGRQFSITNPATGEPIGSVPDAGAADAEQAVAAAQAAFPGWAALPARQRSDILYRWYQAIMDNATALAELITREQGKPLREAKGEIGNAADITRWYAEEANRVYGQTIPGIAADHRIITIRQPVGVAAAITPWNFPAFTIARKVAPALAAGCPVVLKPAEQTPLTAIALIELLQNAGLPAGVVNLLTASDPIPVGRVLTEDPRVRKLSFTGSTEVGKLLNQQAAPQIKRLSLELGGNAPAIVFADADLKRAVRLVAGLKFINAGQACISVNRIYVERSIADAFTAALAERVAGLKVGNGLDDTTRIGPLIDRAALEKVSAMLADATNHGAAVLCGGKAITDGAFKNGHFFEPTVVTGVSDEMRLAREETFGPVAPVAVFDAEAEIIERANASSYGLASYVFTRDISRAVRMAEGLQCGLVAVNDGSLGAAAQAPFGGWKHSGLGLEGGHEGLSMYLDTKHISLSL